MMAEAGNKKCCRREKMNAANHMRIDVAASPSSAEFRPRFNSKVGAAIRRHALPVSQSRSFSITVFIFTAALIAFATNLSMHLLNLRMHDVGISESGIGISIAAQALGIILVAPLTKYVVAAFGIRRSMLLGAFVASSALIACNFVSGYHLFGLVRLIFATGLGLLFTVSETLVITRADATNRGRVVGWYATALAVGTASGPAFITVIGVQGFMPLIVSALLFWLAIVPIAIYVQRGEELAAVVRTSTFAAIRIVPIAFLTAFVFGVADNGGLSMLSLYSTLNGYDYNHAVTITAVATVGSIAFQIPLGYWANNRDPRMVLLLSGVCSIFLLALLPSAMSAQSAAFGISFALGGFLEGLYTIGLICIAKYSRNVGISSANGCFVSICGFGEFVGPLTTGTAIGYLGAQGFVVGLTLLLALYIVLIVLLKQGTETQAAPQVERKYLGGAEAA